MMSRKQSTGITPGLLDEMRRQADPLADAAMARIIGPCPQAAASCDTQWSTIAETNRQMAQWVDNASLDDAPAPQGDDRVGAALQDYLRSARALPAWADAQKIQRAEQIFLEHGALSCALLFCASLPQCYVFPALAGVLHTAGQLEAHTEHRIRSTAAMIFPVMMPGGLTQAEGGGTAQILKVRLIHATIRHLILRGNPQEVLLRASQQATPAGNAGMVAPMALPPEAPDMYRAMFARGWNLGQDGLPCNQVELAYTLMTFGYVFLQGLRRLGIGLSRPDEEAYLHAWNVVGHLLGIQAALMAHTMEDGQALFKRLQDYGRSAAVAPDPRPALAQALMQTMARVIPWAVARPFPLLMTRYLCGAATARDLDLTGPVPWSSRLLFGFLLLSARAIDVTVRLFAPEFSMSRSLTRVLGYHFMQKILMDQTRPLKLPERVLNQTRAMMDRWRVDPHAPRWLAAMEARLTQEQ